MPVPLPAVLAALVALVVVYCSVGVVTRRRWPGVARHRRDIDAWHVVMGVAMIGMLLGTLSRPVATVALVVAGVAVCWGALSTERRSAGSAHVRLLVGATAMAVMTLPLAAPAQATGSPTAAAGAAGMPAGGSSSALLVGILLAALGAVAVTRLPVVVRRGAGAVGRLDACCDVVMAGAMAALLVALL
ncbi:DUF5134 domain-containing protein [Nocardioides cynanchi]|uniref:DUF5134 domain-containing protein n=1 Tax=Nocardioides cynanchi TaxID=2558918 RepID=UPI0012448771|nr:DUF5134 domain-containing protein [Nocardioides cynanchi]